MTKYMLDTDICSYIMREKPLQVLERFNTLEMDQFCLSIISYAEFLYGIQRAANPSKHQGLVDQFIVHVDILLWDRVAAEHYSQIRAELEGQGMTIGNMDMMIAAHARSQGMILVTNNEKHFKRVSNLLIENWTK
ncbi:type II toxin-antitoxin system tRNA(fMet)-specific endonuclease VapC [Desulfospira joergensenii]|uniref:type II toxin-antitoxin system tRNA(fMet)-specific endonuclease VapC n=1 Tax=Desulfospira joergensenii TaxID=53329 RepID=UPI0003B6DD81|nr:type II toxin-antitoxin system VapC family toxin [Desulfospira joergensenii]